MHIAVLRKLTDMTSLPEDHPAFAHFFRDAGALGRIEYLLARPDTRHRDTILAEARRLDGQSQYGPELQAAIDELTLLYFFAST